MTNLEIIENNKLIAGFMAEQKDWRGKTVLDRGFKANFTMGNYHCRWDWLMPAVEKIESLNLGDVPIHSETFGNDIYFNCSVEIEVISSACFIHLHGNMRVYKDLIYIRKEDTKIKAVWLAVIEFIKWHNQQNPKP